MIALQTEIDSSSSSEWTLSDFAHHITRSPLPPSTSPSFYERNSLMSVLIGGFTYWTSYNSVNQTMVQRYMSLPNLKTARHAIAMFTVGIAFFVSTCCYAGVMVYAHYFKCDPLSTGAIKADDQLLPGFVMETMGDWSGIPGLFIAGIFGAALSSLSVVLNSTRINTFVFVSVFCIYFINCF